MTGEHRRRRNLSPAIAPAVVFLLLGTPCRAEDPVTRPPQFEKDVLPILTARCLKCHGADKFKAGLDLRTSAGMLKGGESGPALVPGSADRSLLFQMVRKGE